MSLTKEDLQSIKQLITDAIVANNVNIQKMIDDSNAEQMDMIFKHFATRDEVKDLIFDATKDFPTRDEVREIVREESEYTRITFNEHTARIAKNTLRLDKANISMDYR